MAKTPKETQSPIRADRSLANPIHSHETLLNRFDQTRDTLEQIGWAKARVDTYEHPAAPGHTIKHQYVHGEIEIHHVCPDRQWPGGTSQRSTVVLSRYRNLPTVVDIVDGLTRGCQHTTAKEILNGA